MASHLKQKSSAFGESNEDEITVSQQHDEVELNELQRHCSSRNNSLIMSPTPFTQEPTYGLVQNHDKDAIIGEEVVDKGMLLHDRSPPSISIDDAIGEY